MITSRKELKEYLEADKKMKGITKKRPALVGDEVWKFQIALRHYEYCLNTHKRIWQFFWGVIFHHLSITLGFDIFPNVFGKGLCIHHFGCIVVSKYASVGENCIINQCVNIGQNKDVTDVPRIGNNVYIGPGVQIFGAIEIADDIAIGAGSVVNKSFTEPAITIAGVPARKIGERDYRLT